LRNINLKRTDFKMNKELNVSKDSITDIEKYKDEGK